MQHSAHRQIRLQCEHVSVAYDRQVALYDLNFAVEGNIIAVLGHNGAGKSTLIKSILGLLPPKAGTISVFANSDSGSRLLSAVDDMAFCPETGAVFADISVESYIKLWCRIRHHDANYYRKQGSRFVELLSLEPLFGKLGRELSKGQRRRVQTAIGFLTAPQLFLFDEPFDGLDVQKTNELVEIIEAESKHTSFIISSHRMDVIERLSDKIVVLRAGALAACGTVEEVCQTLCGQSLRISHVQQHELLLSSLRQRYPELLVGRIGEDLALTGFELERASIAEFVQHIDANGASVDSIRPSLTDAMNFHLRSLE
jgi:ABC-2 type transport system ATP-binding protein